MPLYKRTKSGRYKRKRNVYAKRTFNKGVKALRIARQIQRSLNTEKKWVDRFNTAATASSVAQIISLCDLQQGTTAESRIGENIKLVSLYLKMWLSISNAATNTAIRVMIVEDKQCNGTTFILSDLLEHVGSPTQQVVSPLNLNNKYRFKIHFDKVYILSINGNRGLFIDYFKSLEEMIRYKSNNGDVTDLASKNFYLVYMSNEAVNVAGVPYQFRFRFVDN